MPGLDRVWIREWENGARSVYDEPREGAEEYERKESSMSNVHTIDGPLGRFVIPESANPRTREVCEALSRQVFDGEYEDYELPPAAAVKVVIDVGAGWGAFAVWAAKKWPGATIVAYEPHGEARDYFRVNVFGAVREAPSPAIELRAAAVTTDPAPRLNGCEDWGAYHTRGVAPDGGWRVAGEHPKDLPPCDVLKVDCEGCEVEVLENYPHLASCSALLVEFHDFEKRALVEELAVEAGFRCVKCPDAKASYGVTVWVK